MSDWIPAEWRKRIYGVIGVVNLALAAGLLAPFGPELSDYVENVVQFVTAVVSGGAFTMAYRHTRGLVAAAAEVVDAKQIPADEGDADAKEVDAPDTYPASEFVAFPSRRKAELYAIAAWAWSVRMHAAAAGDVLRSVRSGVEHTISQLLPGADFEGLTAWLHSLPPERIMSVYTVLDEFPIFTEDGPRTRWDDPRRVGNVWIVKRFTQGQP